MTVKMKSNGRNAEKRVDLVLEGGGVKGVALVGALAALEDQGYIPQNIAGTSVGAILGALLAAGYTAAELRDIMMNQLDFRRLRDLSLEGQLPLIG
jgi:NTE family protein